MKNDKPSRPDPNAPRIAKLNNVPIAHSLGYICYRDGKRIAIEGSSALEFVLDDDDTMRKGTLSLKTKQGFHVYYKSEKWWYGVPKHFDTIAQAIPYLQTGNRVLVEYQFSIT